MSRDKTWSLGPVHTGYRTNVLNCPNCRGWNQINCAHGQWVCAEDCPHADHQESALTEPVDEATISATAEDLRLAAERCHWFAADLGYANSPEQREQEVVHWRGVADRLLALAAIRDSERATREAEQRVIAIADSMVSYGYSGELVDAVKQLRTLRRTSPEPEEPADAIEDSERPIEVFVESNDPETTVRMLHHTGYDLVITMHPITTRDPERRAAERAVLDTAVALVEWWDPRDTDEWTALQAAVRTLVLLHKA